MLSRLRNALGRLSSATPSVPESSVEDPIEFAEQSTTTSNMVTTRGGRETDSPVVTKAGSAKRQSATKRKIEEEVTSPAAAVKRRRKSRSSAPTKQTEEELFREIVEENSHVDLEPSGAHTKMELRDTPKAVTEEDLFHKIDEQAAQEVSTTEATPHVRRRTTAVVKISPRNMSPRTSINKEETAVVDTIEDVDDILEQTNSAIEEVAEPQDQIDATASKKKTSRGETSQKKTNKSSKGSEKTRMPLRSKIDAAHIVPFEDEATPTASNQPSNASEIIEISDDSDGDDSVDESEFVTGGVPDPEEENLDELDEDIEDGSEADVDEEAEAVDEEEASEEAVGPSNVDSEVEEEPQSQEEDSDDEAPEAITTSKAQKQVEQAQAAAAEAIEKQTTAAKLKRQARDKALKERARKNLKSSKASSSKQVDPEPSEDDAELQDDALAEDMDMGVDSEAQLLPQTSSIPALLPASLLATARPSSLSPIPVVDPRLSRAEEKRSRHLKFIEEGTKRTKDVRKGPVSVRVLEEKNAFMAPAVDKQARNVRETWLQGKRVTKEIRGKHKPNTSAVRVSRKPIGATGFLRK